MTKRYWKITEQRVVKVTAWACAETKEQAIDMFKDGVATGYSQEIIRDEGIDVSEPISRDEYRSRR